MSTSIKADIAGVLMRISAWLKQRIIHAKLSHEESSPQADFILALCWGEPGTPELGSTDTGSRPVYHGYSAPSENVSITSRHEIVKSSWEKRGSCVHTRPGLAACSSMALQEIR
jgi:hypothetical protein